MKIENIAEDHSSKYEEIAKENKALDALADWWAKNCCSNGKGFDEDSFKIGFCLGWQQHIEGMTALKRLELLDKNKHEQFRENQSRD